VKNKWFLLFIFLATAVAIVQLFLKPEWERTQQKQEEHYSFVDRQKIFLIFDEKKLNVEVVNAPLSISKGLGERSEIGSDGMLFLLGSTQHARFWMKDMRFDLDLVWIHNGEVVGITSNVTAPRTPEENQDQNLKIYESPQLVDMVLEIPAGSAQKVGLQKGSVLRFRE
jgi:uncharacterized protein